MGCGLVAGESWFQPEMPKIINWPFTGLMLEFEGHVAVRWIDVMVNDALTLDDPSEPSRNSTASPTL